MSLNFFNTSRLSRKYSSLFQEIACLPLYPYKKTFDYFIDENVPFGGVEEKDRQESPLAALLVSIITFPLQLAIYFVRVVMPPILVCLALTIIPVLPILTLLALSIAVISAALTAVSTIIAYPIALTADLLGIEVVSESLVCDEEGNDELTLTPEAQLSM